jgi:hypothetical protein
MVIFLTFEGVIFDESLISIKISPYIYKKSSQNIVS